MFSSVPFHPGSPTFSDFLPRWISFLVQGYPLPFPTSLAFQAFPCQTLFFFFFNVFDLQFDVEPFRLLLPTFFSRSRDDIPLHFLHSPTFRFSSLFLLFLPTPQRLIFSRFSSFFKSLVTPSSPLPGLFLYVSFLADLWFSPPASFSRSESRRLHMSNQSALCGFFVFPCPYPSAFLSVLFRSSFFPRPAFISFVNSFPEAVYGLI